MANSGYKVVVTGRVQGVCFRHSTAMEARQLGITGYAKNLRDGSVEVIMFGENAQLQVLLTWLETGSKRSIINSIVVDEIDFKKETRFLTL